MTLAPFLLLALSQTSPPLETETKRQTIDSLFSAMRSDYVFPEVATHAETEVRRKWAAREYEAITTGPEFAQRLTRDLREVCRDAHLSVQYSATPLPSRQVASQPSAEEIAQRKLWVKRMNGGFRKTEILPGNVGYIRFDGFMEAEAAREPMRAAMEFVANTDALIFDVRWNGGGQPETVQLICSYLFDKRTHLNDLYWRKEEKTTEYWTLPEVPGKRYLGRDVYILTGKQTGSAAEEFSYNLKNLKRATLVGESTWGGANPGGVVRLNDHFSAFIPRGRAINPITKTNWEGTGVEPDVKVPVEEALPVAHRAAIESFLKKETDAGRRQALEGVLKGIPSKG